jgi:pyrimidine deaminase RibD-like protein
MALVVHQNNFYYNDEEQFSVGSLIEEIWKQLPQEARHITRNRVYFTVPLTPFCDGILKVAGKRASLISAIEYNQKLDELFNTKTPIKIKSTQKNKLDFPFPQKKSLYTFEEAMNLAESLTEFSKIKIGAVLLDSKNQLISWGWNQHSDIKTHHAEIMLINNYIATFQSKIPPQCTLITTLQPCAMCAGYLHAFCEDFNSLKIIYKNKDPGPKAQNSILVPGSPLWKNANQKI